MLSVGAESVGLFGRGGLAGGRWDASAVAKRSGNPAVQHAFTCATAVRPPHNQVRDLRRPAPPRTLAHAQHWLIHVRFRLGTWFAS